MCSGPLSQSLDNAENNAVMAFPENKNSYNLKVKT